MPTVERTVDIQAEAVDYEIRRGKKASQIRIDARLDGITLVMPEWRDVDPEEVLLEKADWVLKQKDRFERYRAQIPERQFDEGEVFPVLGSDRTVVVGETLFSHVTEDKIHLDSSKVDATSIKVEREHLCREEARRYFTEQADHFSEVLGVNYEQIQIRNHKTRWGSYSRRTGRLSLTFRLLMGPREIIDYVIVHELAHAKHPNHGSRFWRLVERHVALRGEKRVVEGEWDTAHLRRILRLAFNSVPVPDPHQRTVQIFLPDGNPRTARILEITGRTVQAVQITGKKIGVANEREEVPLVGLYFLFGAVGDDASKPSVYLGKSIRARVIIRGIFGRGQWPLVEVTRSEAEMGLRD